MNKDRPATEEEMAKLKELDRIVSRAETAEALYNLDEGRSLSAAVNRLADAGLAQRYGTPFRDPVLEELDDEEENDLATIRGAVANHRASKFNKPIKIGVNKTKTLFNGVKKDTSTRSFNAAGDKVAKIANSMSEDQITNHRTVNNGNLEWVKRKPSASMIASVKAAALKSRANKTACENEYLGINETAMAILQRHVALKEDNNTAAARTLATHKVNEPSVRDRLPDTFKQSGLLPAKAQPNVDKTTATTTQIPTDDVAIRMPEFDTRKGLAGTDFAPKITPTIDNSFAAQTGRMKNPTAAAATRDRPKPVFADPQNNDQGVISVNQPSAKPTSTTNSGPDSYKEVNKSKSREGQWPSDPSRPWYPEEAASSREPESRW